MDQKTNRLIDVEALTSEQVLEALQRLEAEKRKRFEARVAAGEVVTVLVIVLIEDDVEAAKAAAIQRHLADNPQDKDKELVLDLVRIDTGVPRSDEE
jgi:hypothetical protein